MLAWLQIVVGCVIGAAAYPTFLDPGKIAPGGLTGVAMILKHLWGWDIGITSLILNIPLFIVGYKAMGRVFAFRSLIATVLFSLMIDLLPLKAIPVEPILGTLYGGILLGIGLGFILRGGEFDYERGAKALIDDFRKGRLGKICLENPNDYQGWEF